MVTAVVDTTAVDTMAAATTGESRLYISYGNSLVPMPRRRGNLPPRHGYEATTIKDEWSAINT